LQAYDFYWDRESGLRVNIGILDVHLIPEYEDVDHSADSDNEYMMAHPHDSDEKIRFQQVTRNYCRSLAPHAFTKRNVSINVKSPFRATRSQGRYLVGGRGCGIFGPSQ